MGALHPVLRAARQHPGGPMTGPGIYIYVEAPTCCPAGVLLSGTPRYIGDTGGGMRWRAQFDVARRYGTDPSRPIPCSPSGRPRFRNAPWKAHLARSLAGQGPPIEVFTIMINPAERALCKEIERRMIAEIGRQPTGPLMNGCGGGGGDYGAATGLEERFMSPDMVRDRLAAMGFAA